VVARAFHLAQDKKNAAGGRVKRCTITDMQPVEESLFRTIQHKLYQWSVDTATSGYL